MNGFFLTTGEFAEYSIYSTLRASGGQFFGSLFSTETQRAHGSTVREASRQASSTAFSSEPVEESPRAEFFIAAHPELSRRTRLSGE
jgi:hypothetical protein